MRLLLLAAIAAFSVSGPRAQGTPFKDEIDGLIRALRATGAPGMADGSVLHTAQVLTAMGHCHRFYSVADGPLVRPALNHLFSRRGDDGLFHERDGDSDPALVTGWVVEALSVLGPDDYRHDIRAAEAALRGKGADGEPPFQARLGTLRAGLGDPSSAATAMRAAGAAAAGRVARGPVWAADGSIDFAASVEALIELVACQVVARAPVAPAAKAAVPAPWSETQQRGVDYLLQHQKEGAFQVPTPQGPVADAGFTALCLAAIATKPAAQRSDAERRAVESGLLWLQAQQRDDGSFSDSNVNYVACTAVMALAAADDPRFAATLARARKLIVGLQNVEGRGYSTSDRDYGSIGYGGDERGDLSNLQFALDALVKSGLDASQSDAFAKALVFLQRTQNLREVNDFEAKERDPETGEWRTVTSGDDGGSAYYPGNSPAGYQLLNDGRAVPRSYGSMTYALLKAYTMCGLERDDPRIVAASRWLDRHWTLDENPGADPALPEKARYQGLYYYYMVMAQALDTAGIDEIRPGDGPDAATVDWRQALRTKLAELQQPDGSWVNSKNGRWWEMLPMTCTCYALLALDRCR